MPRSKRKSGKEYATPFSECLSKLVEKEMNSDNNISLSDIAKRMGVPKRSLDDWKDNASAASTDSLPKIAEYYGVSYDFLMGASDDPARVPAATDEIGLDPVTVSRLRELNDKAKSDESEVSAAAIRFIDDLVCSVQFLKIAVEYEKFKEGLLQGAFVLNTLDGKPVDTIIGNIPELLFNQAMSEFLHSDS